MEKEINEIRRLINLIREFSDKVNGIIDFTDNIDFEKYGDIIWKYLEKSYEKIGGFKSYNSKNEMVNRISLLRIFFEKNEILAFAIYRNGLGGQKLVGCGTNDGSQKSKECLRAIIKDDIDNIEKWHWVEVSYPLEKMFKELNGNPIPSELADTILLKSVEEVGDGVHYKRKIKNGSELITKAIYGFKDNEIYKQVINNLEKITGFSKYEDFKDKVNKLPKINEDITYNHLHKNPEIATAMKIIIDLTYMWDEDEIKELTPKMYQYLVYALNILKNFNEKTPQIEGLIKDGTYIMENATILYMYNLNDEEKYLMSPAF